MSERICPVCQSFINDDEQICAVCHFKLTGVTEKFKPLASSAAISTAPEGEQKAALRMIRGPQVGAVYPINSETTTIGRNPQCDIFLNDMTVSRDHATIVKQANVYIINDLQSFNGIWVNNQSVTQHALRPGDYLQIGKYDFIYEETDESSNTSQGYF